MSGAAIVHDLIYAAVEHPSEYQLQVVVRDSAWGQVEASFVTVKRLILLDLSRLYWTVNWPHSPAGQSLCAALDYRPARFPFWLNSRALARLLLTLAEN